MQDSVIVYLRSIWAWLVGIVSLMFYSSLSVIAALSDKSGDSSHLISGKWSRAVLWGSGIKVDIKGLEHLDPKKAQVIISNHQGNFDIWILMAHLPVQFRWLLKQELFKIPFLGPAMRASQYIAVDRKHPRKRDIILALKRLKCGKSLMVFPEGTRSEDGKVGEFKRGAFMLAYKSGAPIVPVSIKGSYDIMKKGCWLFHPRRITMVIQPPVAVNNLDKEAQKELPAKIRQSIMDSMS